MPNRILRECIKIAKVNHFNDISTEVNKQMLTFCARKIGYSNKGRR